MLEKLEQGKGVENLLALLVSDRKATYFFSHTEAKQKGTSWVGIKQFFGSFLRNEAPN